MKLPPTFRLRRLPNKRLAGLTLVEVLVSLFVLSFCMLGMLATLTESRRITEQNSREAVVKTAVQGILEQLKNYPVGGITGLSRSPANAATAVTMAGAGTLPTTTVYVNGVQRTLTLSPLPFLDISTISNGAVPADANSDGLGDLNADGTDDVAINVITVDYKNTPGVTNDDLQVNLWIWVQDYTIDPAALQSASHAIVINYTWTTTDGNKQFSHKGTARAIRTNM
jgi:type II secretory pathway pseudopilin PulG